MPPWYAHASAAMVLCVTSDLRWWNHNNRLEYLKAEAQMDLSSLQAVRCFVIVTKGANIVTVSLHRPASSSHVFPIDSRWLITLNTILFYL